MQIEKYNMLNQIKIIDNYWTDKNQEIKSEFEIEQHFKQFGEPECFFKGFKRIKNFCITTTNTGYFKVRYGLKKNCQRKYYNSFLNSKFAVCGKNLMALNDKNWLDYDKRILTQETINLLTTN
jgi:hypothetical protein